MKRSEGERKWVAGASGSIAGTIAELVTLPMDTLKVRMQINAGSRVLPLRRVVGDVVAQEGLGGFFKGLTPAVARQITYQGIKMLIYEPIRDVAMRLMGTDSTQTQADDVIARFVTGGTAGAIGTFISSPTDIMKVRMQADVDGSRYRGSIIYAVRTVVQKEGIKAFWKGANANIQRSFIVNASELATYDTTKDLVVKRAGWNPNSTTTHVFSAFAAGLVAAITSTPIDLAKTRLMNAGDGNTVYRSIFDCLRKTAAEEGVMALYKGFLPNWLRLAPWTLAFFLSFEMVRPKIVNVDIKMKEWGM